MSKQDNRNASLTIHIPHTNKLQQIVTRHDDRQLSRIPTMRTCIAKKLQIWKRKHSQYHASHSKSLRRHYRPEASGLSWRGVKKSLVRSVKNEKPV